MAGSVLGDGAASAGGFRGIAPKAKLFFQSLLDARGDLGGLPVALEDLFEPAYQAGARIHNNSWGAATASAYTVDSMDVDDYVFKRKDMLIVIAAGNAGTAAANVIAGRGFVDWLTLGSPGTSKGFVDADDLRLSAFGGPVLQDDDRAYRGIPLPREYWIIIAFIEQGQLKSRAFRLTQYPNQIEAPATARGSIRYSMVTIELARRIAARAPPCKGWWQRAIACVATRRTSESALSGVPAKVQEIHAEIPLTHGKRSTKILFN